MIDPQELRQEIEAIINRAGDPPIDDEEPYIDTDRIRDEFLALIEREKKAAVEEARTALRFSKDCMDNYFDRKGAKHLDIQWFDANDAINNALALFPDKP